MPGTRRAATLRFLAGRVAQGAIVVLGAVTISFVLASVIGNPVDVFGGQLPPEQREAIVRELGYDRPLAERYAEYLGRVVQADFGTQYRTGESALTPVLRAAPYSALLVAVGLGVSLLAAAVLAAAAVVRRGGRLDRSLTVGAGAVQGVPDFLWGLVLVIVLSSQLGWFPSFGYTGPSSVVLPGLTLALVLTGPLFRLFRAQLLDVMGRDFVLALRAKGLSERAIVVRHGLRNIAVPTTTFLALQIGWLLGGSIIIEYLFAWPGLGTLLISSVQQRELTIMQATVVVVACAYVLLNLLADMVAVRIDPRTASRA